MWLSDNRVGQHRVRTFPASEKVLLDSVAIALFCLFSSKVKTLSSMLLYSTLSYLSNFISSHSPRSTLCLKQTGHSHSFPLSFTCSCNATWILSCSMSTVTVTFMRQLARLQYPLCNPILV